MVLFWYVDLPLTSKPPGCSFQVVPATRPKTCDP